MLQTPIHGVFFDADDTLFTLRESIGQSYSRLLAHSGISVPADSINARLREVWNEFKDFYLNTENEYKTDPDIERAVWFEFGRRLLGDLVPADTFDIHFEPVYQYYGKAESRTLRTGVSELLFALKQNNILTGVISNNDRRVVQVLSEMQLAAHFDHIFPSAEIGVKKPSPECFVRVQKYISLPAETLLYVGDNPELDYHAARAAGWQSILLCSKSTLDANLLSVSSFAELGELLFPLL